MLSDSEDISQDEPESTMDAHEGDAPFYDPQVTEVAGASREIFTSPVNKLQPQVGDMPREIPVRLGRYIIEGELGRGAMGVVYKARQEGLDRPVALKILLRGEFASKRMRKRFEREAKAIAKLRHPNIVNVHEVGDFEGQPFFTMDLVDGLTLDVFAKRVDMSPKVIADLCRRIALAADYAHTNGIIHRDLKPTNIIVDRNSEPIITDFGLAKEMDSFSMLSMTGDVMGTPAYMAPEQAEGKINEVGARSDVYSLGSILYAILVKRDPFEGKTMVETLNKVIHQDPAPVNVIDPRIDEDLAAICMKAMEKDPAHRYYSAKDMARDLENFINGRPVHARQWSSRRKLAKFIGRNRMVATAAALCVLLAVLSSLLSLELVGRDYVDLAARQLSSDNSEVRARALQTLGRELQNPEVLKPENRDQATALLLGAWEDPHVDVKASLLRVLADHGDLQQLGTQVPEPMAAWLIQTASSTQDAEQASAALAAIGELRRPEFVRYLIGRLNEPNPAVRLRVVRSLGNQQSSEALGPLINLIIKDPVCRGEAEAALEKFYEGGRLSMFGKHDRMAKGALKHLQSALGQYHAQMEAALGETQPQDQDVWAPYQDALKSGDEAVRLQAVYELGRTGEAGAGRILVGLLPEEGSVGEAAALSLGRSGLKDVFKVLPAGLSAEKAVERYNTALAMGFSGQKTFSDALLVAAAQESSEDVRAAMISAVGEIGDPAAVPSLKNLARDYPVHGETISRILRRMPDPN
jgi:serine/threonine protein kinase